MEPVLYYNPQGKPVTHSSYSARLDFKKCPKYFQLTRIDGWSDKTKRAAPLFGKCIEAGVQAYETHDRAPGSGTREFERLWNDVKTIPEFNELVYTESEGNWESLLRAGREMMRLYEIRAPFLPISTNPKALFQQTLRKKLWPNTELDKLENKAVFDILSFPAWNHPLLPVIPAGEDPTKLVRSLVIDMKTSGDDLATDMVMLDPQLAEYAWQARIPDIAFLWFVKRGHDVERGSRITLLKDCDLWKAGFECYAIAFGTVQVDVTEPGAKKPKVEDRPDGTVFIGMLPTLLDYKQTLHGLRGKNRDAAEAVWFSNNQEKIARVPISSVTKQRLQFGAARLIEEDMNEIGRDVAQTTIEMVKANSEQYYPRTGRGIRFPNEVCPLCSMRWICMRNSDERDKHLTRKGEEWLDGGE